MLSSILDPNFLSNLDSDSFSLISFSFTNTPTKSKAITFTTISPN